MAWGLGSGLGGRGVVVAGAVGGVGRPTGQAFASAGARVVAVDLRQSAADEVVASLGGDGHMAVGMDLRGSPGSSSSWPASTLGSSAARPSTSAAPYRCTERRYPSSAARLAGVADAGPRSLFRRVRPTTKREPEQYECHCGEGRNPRLRRTGWHHWRLTRRCGRGPAPARTGAGVHAPGGSAASAVRHWAYLSQRRAGLSATSATISV